MSTRVFVSKANLDGTIECVLVFRCQDDKNELWEHLTKEYANGTEITFDPEKVPVFERFPNFEILYDFLENGKGKSVEYVFVWVQRKAKWFYVSLNCLDIWADTLRGAIVGDAEPCAPPPDGWLCDNCSEHVCSEGIIFQPSGESICHECIRKLKDDEVIAPNMCAGCKHLFSDHDLLDIGFGNACKSCLCDFRQRIEKVLTPNELAEAKEEIAAIDAILEPVGCV